ncbi:MAG: DUF3536 domain-containing protein [Fibrobacter intestinalis]|uniref:DUF3536 domain-containing protein n=1 Tax=Fibrobacter intestinalis TaxID=28122 RepID=UPI003F0AD2A5
MATQPLYFAIHGHFYQPPRENPWTGEIENQPSAAPFHDWNDRIAAQCYSPNAASRILSGSGRIQDIVNNYEYMSFNMGPTLMGWIRTHLPDTYRRIQEADAKTLKRLGHGNAIAQVYNHIIMPLASPEDRITQIRWGIRDFETHFGRKPEAMWLAETAINMDVVVDLIREGIRFTILSPTQAECFRPLDVKNAEWKGCENTDIDTTRPYRIYPVDADGKKICDGYLDVFFYNPWLSSAVGFEHLLRDANVFGKRIQDGFDPNRDEPQLVSIGTDGESYGHHEPFGDMCAAWLFQHYAPEHNMVPVNFGWFLEKFPPKFEVRLKNSHAEGCAWSCAHGVGRWYRDCGCSTGGGADWNQKWRTPLRDAMNFLKKFADDVFVREMEKISAVSPWDARNLYIDALVKPEEKERKEKFLDKILKDPKDKKARTTAIRLLEVEKFCMFSFTSCGWFFNDIEGLEPVQNMRYAERALELLRPFLPINHPLRDQFLSILGRATSNEHRWSGTEVFVRYAMPDMPVAFKLLAERAVVLHLGLEKFEEKSQLDSRLTASVVCSRKFETIVHASFDDADIGETTEATILALNDTMGRVTAVVFGGVRPEEVSFIPNFNATVKDLQMQFPTAYIVRMRNLMSDSLRHINQLLTNSRLEKVTQAFDGFAIQHGLSIDSLADQDHTLTDTMRKALSLEINAKIHEMALRYLKAHDETLLNEVHELVDEAKSLNTNFSFGGTGRMFHKKLSELIAAASEKNDELVIKHITGLISMAGWLNLYIDKTSLENQAFESYKRYIADSENPQSRALLPMFDWLNFERRTKDR